MAEKILSKIFLSGFRKEVNVTTILLFPPRLMKLEQKKAATLYHAGFNSYLYQKKRWTPRGRQQNRGEDRRRVERGMKG